MDDIFENIGKIKLNKDSVSVYYKCLEKYILNEPKHHNLINIINNHKLTFGYKILFIEMNLRFSDNNPTISIIKDNNNVVKEIKILDINKYLYFKIIPEDFLIKNILNKNYISFFKYGFFLPKLKKKFYNNMNSANLRIFNLRMESRLRYVKLIQKNNNNNISFVFFS